uniref:Uncharacterized protein n=1 Tax=Bactrocera latifrons TaxID=174628 RepID=A0A0K8V9Z2_BACLA
MRGPLWLPGSVDRFTTLFQRTRSCVLQPSKGLPASAIFAELLIAPFCVTHSLAVTLVVVIVVFYFIYFTGDAEFGSLTHAFDDCSLESGRRLCVSAAAATQLSPPLCEASLPFYKHYLAKCEINYESGSH